jgi:uncharacterized protein (TIGR03067 family)
MKYLLQYLVLTLMMLVFANTSRASDDPDLGKLRGRWKIVEMTINGKAVREGIGQVMVIGTETISEEESNDKTAALKYRIDSSKSPRQIDIGHDESGKEDFDEKKANFSKGIYALKDDRLTLCFEGGDSLSLCQFGETNSRPADFPKKAEPHMNVLVLERIKEASDADKTEK